MQIILIQAEIEVAIRNYVNSKVKIAAGQDIRIDLSASRGPEGFRANIDIVDALVPVEAYSPRTTAVEADEPGPAPAPTPKKKAAPVQQETEVEEPASTPATASTEKAAVDEPSAQEQEVAQEQEASNVEETTEASTTESAPAVRKPLFGKSLAPLNA